MSTGKLHRANCVENPPTNQFFIRKPGKKETRKKNKIIITIRKAGKQENLYIFIYDEQKPLDTKIG
jgi:hypothetical protein